MEENNQTEDNGQTPDIGKYARHPRRTAGGAFLIGTIFGKMMATRKHRSKTPMQKFMDRMNH